MRAPQLVPPVNLPAATKFTTRERHTSQSSALLAVQYLTTTAEAGQSKVGESGLSPPCFGGAHSLRAMPFWQAADDAYGIAKNTFVEYFAVK